MVGKLGLMLVKVVGVDGKLEFRYLGLPIPAVFDLP
jgi:hypothetical protein